MARKLTPEEKRIQQERERAYLMVQLMMQTMYDKTLALPQIRSAIKASQKTGKPFYFENYSQAERAVNKALRAFSSEMNHLVLNGIQEAWEEGDKGLWREIGERLAKSKEEQELFNAIRLQATGGARSENALNSFIRQKRGGYTLSERVWNITEANKKDLEIIIQNGIKEGLSADDMASYAQKYLRKPNRLFRRVRNATTKKLELSEAARKYHPGQGVYRSSYKNALRLVSNEINRSYRESTWTQFQNNPLVIGYEIQLSNNHTCSDGKGGIIPGWTDICDTLAGRYPKWFKWTGWHPNCYSDDTEVLTNHGWKLFKDLNPDDLIFSLNPITKIPEFVKYIDNVSYQYDGPMIRYYNRSLDMLVTLDHKMVYLNKTDGRIMDNKRASEFKATIGALYRSSEYQGGDIKDIQIGRHLIQFDLYVEFMAYYLSDGSISWTRNRQLSIAKSKIKNAETYLKINELLQKLPFKFTPCPERFYISDSDLYIHLKQFGKSTDKYIPEIIKNASRRQIKLFLDAYVVCDGHVKKQKPFIGNRGGLFVPKNPDRLFFTSSNQLAADLGELLVKSGKRPGYKLHKLKGKIQKHKNGNYVCNADIWNIAECHSETAAVFNKDYQNYSGLVYDIELERNHILYVRRNGKCVWGSNCRCRMIAILISKADFAAWVEAGDSGLLDDWEAKDSVDRLPRALLDWVEQNKGRIERASSLPYWIADNSNFLGL